MKNLTLAELSESYRHLKATVDLDAPSALVASPSIEKHIELAVAERMPKFESIYGFKIFTSPKCPVDRAFTCRTTEDALKLLALLEKDDWEAINALMQGGAK